MIFFKTVSQSQALQAADFYTRHGWTQDDVGEAMGWHRQKVAKVLRCLERYGVEVFARDRRGNQAKAIRRDDSEKAGGGLESGVTESPRALTEDDQTAPCIGVGA